MWTLFVLDMDGTYDSEYRGPCGVSPLVYLVPLKKLTDVERYAIMAGKDFHLDENRDVDFCIGDYFEEWLDNNDVAYQLAGEINLAFGERQFDYLDDNIPREVV